MGIVSSGSLAPSFATLIHCSTNDLSNQQEQIRSAHSSFKLLLTVKLLAAGSHAPQPGRAIAARQAAQRRRASNAFLSSSPTSSGAAAGSLAVAAPRTGDGFVAW